LPTQRGSQKTLISVPRTHSMFKDTPPCWLREARSGKYINNKLDLSFSIGLVCMLSNLVPLTALLNQPRRPLSTGKTPIDGCNQSR
jgi:hypothetical protein